MDRQPLESIIDDIKAHIGQRHITIVPITRNDVDYKYAVSIYGYKRIRQRKNDTTTNEYCAVDLYDAFDAILCDLQYNRLVRI